MRKLFWAAVSYTTLGLAGGLYFRELTKAKGFTGYTELAVVHTHLLVLGMVAFLLLIALEKTLLLSAGRRLFGWFFWVYNAGLVVTVGAMTVIGTRTVLGLSNGAMLAGIAGLGHILLTIALALLMVALGRRILPAAPRPASIPGSTAGDAEPQLLAARP